MEELDTPEGQQQLEDELKRMAEAPEPGSEEGERQKKLDEAQEGAGDAEKQLGQGDARAPAGRGRRRRQGAEGAARRAGAATARAKASPGRGIRRGAGPPITRD